MVKQRKGYRLQAIILTVAMVFSLFSVPMASYAEEPEPGAGIKPMADGKILYYDFKDYSSTIINDASGNGFAAVMQNYDKGGFKIVDDSIYGKPVKALELPGGEGGGYLEFPQGVLGTGEAATISMWVNLSTNTAYQRIWDFGNNTTSYFYLLSDGNNTGARGYATAITLSGWSNEQTIQKEPAPSNIAKNQWVLTTVVLDGKTLKLYENGAKIGERTTTIGLAELGATTQNYIGKGQFTDPPTKGRFAEVNLYNYALSDAEIAAMYNVEDSDRIDDDAATLSLGDLSGLIADITLPTKGGNGSDIAWVSNNAAIAINGNTAKVTRPASGEKDVDVKLTATLTLGGLSRTVVFDATVLAEFSNKQIAEHDAAALDLGDTSGVFRNITLPANGAWGSSIVWDSSNESVISSEGKVSRPDAGSGNATVTLTATVRYNNYWLNKKFTCTVLEKKAVATIASVEPIAVKTKAGFAPMLPNYVKATYSDGTTANIDTIWPATITASSYANPGTFTVAGKLIGSGFAITATVTVLSDLTVENTIKATLFDLSDVTLDSVGTRIKDNEGRTVEYLKLLDNDRMLYNFRRAFGQDTKGAAAVAGWDEPTGLLRGHSTGHYISAMSLAYASTGDEAIKTKVDYMIHELRELQKLSKGNAADFVTACTPSNAAQSLWSTDPNVWGEGFISAYSPDQFALLEQYTPYATIWAPYYTLHKIMAGFIDAYQYTGNQEALDAAKALGKWVYQRLSACSQAQLTRMWGMYIAGEFGGFNEVMARLYQITGDDDFLKGARLFDNTTFFDNLDKNIDDIKTRHANQHIPQITGALKIYEGTVKEGTPNNYYFNVANNFWHMVVSRYAYSIGGVGRGERFQQPYSQAADISGTENCETCAAYNMLKLTKDLYKYSPDDAEYMDYYERTLINQIVASQSPVVTATRHNGTTYMLPIGPGATRSYGSDYTSFTCCHGTGMENHVKYQEAVYYRQNDKLYVNLYLPSTLTWTEKGVEVVQENIFPSEHSRLTVKELTGKTAQSFDMKLRVPYWATGGFTVKVNGETKYTKPEVSTYITLEGIKAGDVIDIDMPFGYHLDRTPDQLNSTDVASLMYGPLVMVARDSSTTMKTLNFMTDLSDSITKTEGAATPALTTNGLNFAPMYAAHDYAYHTYFKVIVSEEDPVNQYDVYLTNSTSANGTFTIDKDRVVEGGDVVITAAPNAGYKVSALTINGAGVTMRANNTYTVHDVKATLQIVGSFGMINPPMPNLAQLEQWAKPSAHFTASWENISRITLRTTPASSAPGTGNGWGNWSQANNFVAWIAYTWDSEVPMNTFNIYWYDDQGGTRIPRAMTIEYWDSASQTWKQTPMISAFSDVNKRNQFNEIKFETVTTSQIRLQLSHNNAAGTGILRWWVSAASDKPTLQSAVANAKAVSAQDYTADSYGALDSAILAAEAVIEDGAATSATILSAMQAIYSAKQALSPKLTGLNAAIATAEAVSPEGYTAASWTVFTEELANAKAISALSNASAAQVNAAIAGLEAAEKNLKADKAPLRALLQTARAKDSAYFTETSWSKFETAYLAAEELYANANATKDEVSATAVSLSEAISGLKSSADISRLQLYLLIYESNTAGLEKQVLRTVWEGYAKALADAKAIIATPENYTQAEVDTAEAAYLTAVAAVRKAENRLDTMLLSIFIDEAKELLKDSDKKTASSIKALEKAIAAAEDAIEARESQAKIEKATDDLWDAIFLVYDRGDVAQLAVLSGYTNSLDKTAFTAESWAKVDSALDVVDKVFAKDTEKDASIYDVDYAFETLYAALTALEFKVTLNFVALDSAIARAEAIVASADRYVASTISGLPLVLTAAKGVRGSATTQAQIDSATVSLAKEIGKARLKADLSGLAGLLGTAEKLNFNLYTVESGAKVKSLAAMASKLTEYNTQEEVDKAAEELVGAMNALKQLPGTSAASPSIPSISSGGGAGPKPVTVEIPLIPESKPSVAKTVASLPGAEKQAKTPAAPAAPATTPSTAPSTPAASADTKAAKSAPATVVQDDKTDGAKVQAGLPEKTEIGVTKTPLSTKDTSKSAGSAPWISLIIALAVAAVAGFLLLWMHRTRKAKKNAE